MTDAERDDMLADLSATWSQEFGEEVAFFKCGCDPHCGQIEVHVADTGVGSWTSLDSAERGVARLWMIRTLP